MTARRDALSVVQVNCAFDKTLADPDELLDRYRTLTGWSEALAVAGADRVAVVQGFTGARVSRAMGSSTGFVARADGPGHRSPGPSPICAQTSLMSTA